MKLAVGLLCFLCVPAWADRSIYIRNAAAIMLDLAPGTILEIREDGTDRVPDIKDLSRLRVTLDRQTLTLVKSPYETALWAVIPLDAPLGDAIITLFSDGEAFGRTAIRVREHAPTMFTLGGFGYGPALSANRLTNPGLPGQVVTLWGTGLGNARDVFVELAGITVRAQYAGHHPDYPGLDQVNFEVPAGAQLGCYVPVTLRVGDAVSNEATLSISDGPGACPHPLGLSYADLVTLDAGGRVPVGRMSVGGYSDVGLPVVAIRGIFPRGPASASLELRNAITMFELAQAQQRDERFLQCRVFPDIVVALYLGGNQLDAGRPATLTAPDGSSYAPDGMFILDPYSWPPAYAPGPWRVRFPGGRDVAPFALNFDLPPAIRDVNRDDLEIIDRDKDGVVTWNPSGYGSADIMEVTLWSHDSVLECRTHAWRGRLVLPRESLSRLPASHEAHLSLSAGPHPLGRQRFLMPLTGGGTGVGVVDYRAYESVNLNLR